MEIKHPEWLQLMQQEQNMYGYNQEWYPTSFQKTRGCGPTAAAMQLLYLNRRETAGLPYQHDSISAITQVLEDVWRFITPGWLLGLNSTQKFSHGMKALTKHYQLEWHCHVQSIGILKGRRPSLDDVITFLQQGLTADCPIAFLNLQRGLATTLQSWHWIVLVSLQYDAEQHRYLATCYDSGRCVTFDVGVWLATSRLGGGFVYLTTTP